MEQQETLRFGRFEIRRRQSQLLADGKPVELGSRAFDVLLALIEAAGMLVTKSELIERGRPDQAVEENNVQVQIHPCAARWGRIGTSYRRWRGADIVLSANCDRGR